MSADEQVIRLAAIDLVALTTARRAVRDHFAPSGPAAADALAILTSELLRASLTDAGLDPRFGLLLRLRRDERGARVEVSEDGHPLAVERLADGRDRGAMRVVGELSDRWGVRRSPDTGLWAEMALEAA